MLSFSTIFRRLPHLRRQRACRASVSQPLALLAWLYAYQANKLAWGGARHGGKRRATPQAALLSRWVRIFAITTGSSIQAMTCTDALMSRAQDAQERLMYMYECHGRQDAGSGCRS